MTKHSRPYSTLALCAAAGFALVLVLYALSSRNPVTSRLGFAVFSSLLPALVALAGLWLWRGRTTKVTAVLCYSGFFVLLQLVLWLIK